MRIKDKGIRIGFEIECMVQDQATSSQVARILESDNREDGSLSTDDSYRETPREFVSLPIVYKSKEYKTYFSKLDTLFSEGDITLNSSCGIHFHFSIPTMADAIFFLGKKEFTSGYEDILKNNFSSLWDYRRHNDYCSSISVDNIISTRNGRYRIINFASYAKHGTIENRFYGYYGHTRLDVQEFQRYIDTFIKYFRSFLFEVDKRKTQIKQLNIFEPLNLKTINYQF